MYACVVARNFPLQVLLRLRPELQQQQAIAVLAGESPSEIVCSVSDAAARLGVNPGMTRVELEMFSGVFAFPRSIAQETAARTALLDCTGCFSPLVEDQSSDGCFICVADIVGTNALFGSSEALAEKLRKRAKALCIETSIVVCNNFHASICLALGCFSIQRTGIRVIPPGMEGTALEPLPVSVLTLSQEHTETLAMWGIHTLGELAGLKETELITRLGQPGKSLRLLARGEAPHLFRAIEPVLLLEERLELDAPVELLDSLVFIAGVMLDQLIVRVQSRILALASITLELGLEDGAVHTRTARPVLPNNDRQLWLKLIHLDLQAHPPSAAIRSLVLHAQPGSTSKVQLGLFSPQVPEPMRLDVTIARIRNIVGEGYVGCAELNDTHRPDAFRMQSFHVPAPAASAANRGMQRLARRLLRPAQVVSVTLRNGQPDSFIFREQRFIVERAYGPWSSGGDWWKPTLWAIEQWDLVAKNRENAAWLCCCLTHDLTQENWQIEALYD